MLLLFSHLTLYNPMDCSSQASLSLTISWSLPSSLLHQWCYPAISPSDTLFSFCPQSFKSSGTFPVSQLFASDDQNWHLASVLPKSIQGWFPSRLTGLISLLSTDSQESPLAIVERYQFFDTLPSLLSSSHDYIWPLGRPEPCRFLSSYKASEFSNVKNSIYEFSRSFWKLLKPFIKKHLHFT